MVIIVEALARRTVFMNPICHIDVYTSRRQMYFFQAIGYRLLSRLLNKLQQVKFRP
jgi:hypothetical protein